MNLLHLQESLPFCMLLIPQFLAGDVPPDAQHLGHCQVRRADHPRHQGLRRVQISDVVSVCKSKQKSAKYGLRYGAHLKRNCDLKGCIEH